MKGRDFFTKKEAKNLHNQTKTHKNIKVLLNRLNVMKTGMIGAQQRASKQMRKARTRTLIQMGALVNLSGLSNLCDIQEDEDLQMNLEAQDKAATLLGILLMLQEWLREDFNEQEKEKLRQKGIRKMKQTQNFK